ncbi:MAG: hypothetical protein WDM89_12815 [Rhizomicrobium sp.]
MAESRTFEALTTKRDEIIRSIDAYETKLDQARADLSHINAAMVLFKHDPDQMLDYKPYSSTNKLFRHGEFSRLCREALKDAELTGAEIAVRIVEHKRMDRQDRVLLKTLSLRVAYTMNALQRGKSVRCVGWRKFNKRKPMRVWGLP